MADYFESGFCVREASWHSKELLLAEYPTDWDDARRSAGILWEPTLQPLYRKVEKIVPVEAFALHGPDAAGLAGTHYEYLDGQWVERVFEYEQANAQEVVRDDTGEVLGNVSDKFELLYHHQMGPIVEAILDQDKAKFETAGSVKGGKQVYVTVRLDEQVEIEGDRSASYPYLVLLNSHDGSGACKVLFTTVRVVCANTFAMADREGNASGAQFSFRHTVGMSDRIAQAKTALRGARAATLEWVGIAEELATISVDADIEAAFIEQFIPMPPTGSISDRVRDNVLTDRSKFRSTLYSVTNVAESNTGLGLVNAAVEYLDHVRGFRNAETLMGRQLLRPEPLKTKAISLVRELTSV